MPAQTTAIQRVGERGIEIVNTNDAWNVACQITESGLCPKAYIHKPRDAMIAILAGHAVGLPAMQALNGIAVIQGRPSMWGDARAAVVLGSGNVEWLREWYELDGKAIQPEGRYGKLSDFPNGLAACWQAKRKDQTEPSPVVRFTIGEARLAGLWGKAGTWTSYPLRMLHMRARAFGERDYFADALAGIGQYEEESDKARPPEHDPLEGEMLEAPANPPGEALVAPPESEPLPDEPPTDQAKRDLLAAVEDYIRHQVVADPLPAGEMIVAAIQQTCGHADGKARNQGDLDLVLSEIEAGKYNLEDGHRIPDEDGQ